MKSILLVYRNMNIAHKENRNLFLNEYYSRIVDSTTHLDTELANTKYDLIIIDGDTDLTLSMEWLKNVRYLNSEIKVIVITNENSDVRRKQLKDLGANDVLSRPISSWDLVDRVNFHLGFPCTNHNRMPFVKPIKIADQTSIWLAKITNLSPNGLCIKSERRYLAGQEIQVYFQLPSQPGGLQMSAKVRWSRVNKSLLHWLFGSSSDNYLAGLEFSAISPIDRDSIFNYVVEHNQQIFVNTSAGHGL